MFSVMDPEEEVTIGFNFANLTTSVTNPVIEVAVVKGTDENASLIFDETPQIFNSTLVLQRIKNVKDGVNYQFRCKIVAENGDVLVLVDTLPVRTAPYFSGVR